MPKLWNVLAPNSWHTNAINFTGTSYRWFTLGKKQLTCKNSWRIFNLKWFTFQNFEIKKFTLACSFLQHILHPWYLMTRFCYLNHSCFFLLFFTSFSHWFLFKKFFYLGFLSQTFTNHRTAGEGGGHFILLTTTSSHFTDT